MNDFLPSIYAAIVGSFAYALPLLVWALAGLAIGWTIGWVIVTVQRRRQRPRRSTYRR